MAIEPPQTEAPTQSLITAAAGDRCVSCGATLTSDQRYCVICGERRGAPRFSVPAAGTATASAPGPESPPPGPRRSRVGAGTTLIAGVATLLLAMLVGVLIGHDTGSTKTVTAAGGGVKIVTIGGGSSAAATPTTAATDSSGASATGSGAGSKSASGTPKAKKTTPPKQTLKKESDAAKKLTGSHSAAPTSTVGSGCAAGSAGCDKKTHKFTGSFFGN